jgi:hypothetical protein
MDTVLSWRFFGVAIPLAFVVATLGMVATFWFYRSWRRFILHLVVAVLAVVVAWIYLGRSVMAPASMAHLHLVDWPADLERDASGPGPTRASTTMSSDYTPGKPSMARTTPASAKWPKLWVSARWAKAQPRVMPA